MTPQNPQQVIADYFKEHGKYLQIPGSNWFLFEDGARFEKAGKEVGVMFHPPADKWERAKLVAQYLEIKSDAAQTEFEEYKHALKQSGQVGEREEKIIHLKKLRGRATRAYDEFRKAERRAKKLIPFWVKQRKKEEIENQRQLQEFMSEVDEIQL